ncbi:unnamed protein product [Boreogadus saida]
MEFEEVGGSVCVFVYVSMSTAASREQGTTGVVSERKQAILKIEQYNMSENGETIFNAPANLKSNVWKSFGFYKQEGNIDKSLAICKLCRTAIKDPMPCYFMDALI